MSPRYGRRNRRYNVKKPKEKMPREKKIAVQSVICTLVLAVMTPLSFVLPKDNVSTLLYTTYSLNDWQKTLLPVTSGLKDTSMTAVRTYMKWIDSAERHFGIDAETKPTAKAKTRDTKKESEKDSSKETEVQEPVTDMPKEGQKPVPRWQLPVWGMVTSPFGERIHPVSGSDAIHTGIDIASEEGKTVVCASEGTVSATGYDDANGNYIIVEHPSGITTVYAHLYKVCVNAGDSVSPDIKIGEVGSTGISTGPHLHFEIKEGGVSVDPAKYVYFEER